MAVPLACMVPQTGRDGMAHVLDRADIFQVGGAGILLVPVLVVHPEARGTRSKEGCGDRVMHVYLSGPIWSETMADTVTSAEGSVRRRKNESKLRDRRESSKPHPPLLAP